MSGRNVLLDEPTSLQAVELNVCLTTQKKKSVPFSIVQHLSAFNLVLTRMGHGVSSAFKCDATNTTPPKNELSEGSGH